MISAGMIPSGLHGCETFYISWTGPVGDLELEMGEKQCPPGLTRIEPFSITEVLQVFVVSENEERLCSSLQPVPPFFEGQLDCKKFSIADVVILLRRAEISGEESTWMESGRRPLRW